MSSIDKQAENPVLAIDWLYTEDVYASNEDKRSSLLKYQLLAVSGYVLALAVYLNKV